LAFRAAALPHPPVDQRIRLELLVVRIGQGDDQEVELLQGAPAQLHDLGILECVEGMLEVDVRDLVSDNELEGIILFLTDQVEETSSHVDEPSGMREDVYRVGIQDRERVGDVFPEAELEQRISN